MNPQHKEKHFLVTGIVDSEPPGPTELVERRRHHLPLQVEAVVDGRVGAQESLRLPGR